MKRVEIIINGNEVTITARNGEIWMSKWEIARLFDVFMAKITSNIKAIFKSGVLRKRDVCYCHHYANGGSVDLYSLEMIIALAYRIGSHNSRMFREWLMRRAVEQPVCFRFSEENTICLN
ncbi:hypothetical protein FACS1894181_13900 [Bacteroidia bacterium]|nr:hypothetical protein FACS1894181_13900 [Bacteroidia bacterium]